MKIDEAIEHNKEVKKMMLKAGRYHPEKAESIQLGIEALEKEKNMRMCHKVLHPADHCELPLLPSETE